MTLPLLTACVIPGCTQPVTTIGEVCDGCRQAFGPFLRSTGRPPMTADQINARDDATMRALAGHRAIQERRV